MPTYGILFYEHILREYALLERIGEKVSEITGGNMQLELFSLAFEWSDAYRFAKTHLVSVVVMPWLRLEFHESYIAPFYALNENLVVIDLNQEQISSPTGYMRNVPRCEYAKRGIVHFAWSPYYREILENEGVPSENIIETGNGRLDFVTHGNANRSDIAKEYGLDPNKKWILFAENRAPSRYDHPDVIQQNLDVGITKDQLAGTQSLARDSLECLSKQMSDLPNSFFDEYEFIYRLHPGQLQETHIDDRVRIISDKPISDWLSICQLFVCWESTSAFEAEIAGLPVIIHHPFEVPAKNQMAGLMEYRVIENLDELAKLNYSEIVKEQASSKVFERYVGPADGRSIERIAKAIVDVSRKGNQYGLAPKADSLHIIRQRVYEFVSRTVCNLNLLEKLKYPRTTYRTQTDIPYISSNLISYRHK